MNTWWSQDGRELFFSEGPTGWSVVSVTMNQGFAFGKPRPVAKYAGSLLGNNLYAPRNNDMAPDGRILAVVNATQGQTGAQPPIHVVVNWVEELKARVPAGRP